MGSVSAFTRRYCVVNMHRSRSLESTTAYCSAEVCHLLLTGAGATDAHLSTSCGELGSGHQVQCRLKSRAYLLNKILGCSAASWHDDSTVNCSVGRCSLKACAKRSMHTAMLNDRLSEGRNGFCVSSSTHPLDQCCDTAKDVRRVYALQASLVFASQVLLDVTQSLEPTLSVASRKHWYRGRNDVGVAHAGT